MKRGHKDVLSHFDIRREPLSLVNVRKRSLESGDDDLPSRMDHYKAKATRHIFLIRHSQYHVDASLEKDRTLTPLGTWGGSPRLTPEAGLLTGAPAGTGPPGTVAGILGPDASVAVVSNRQPLPPGGL